MMNQVSIKRMNKIQKKKKGFTLVELVIVIAVIAILAAMSIPRLGAMRINARISNDVASAKNIATIASTLVANQEIPATSDTTIDLTASGTDDEGKAAAAIKGNLQGSASSGTPEALSGGHFKVAIGANGTITVSVTSGTGDKAAEYQLYPEDQGDKADYGVAARK